MRLKRNLLFLLISVFRVVTYSTYSPYLAPLDDLLGFMSYWRKTKKLPSFINFDAIPVNKHISLETPA